MLREPALQSRGRALLGLAGGRRRHVERCADVAPGLPVAVPHQDHGLLIRCQRRHRLADELAALRGLRSGLRRLGVRIMQRVFQ